MPHDFVKNNAGLGLDQLLASIKHSAGITYDLQGIMRLLTYEKRCSSRENRRNL